MPIYDFRCADCQKLSEHLYPVGEVPETLNAKCCKRRASVHARRFSFGTGAVSGAGGSPSRPS